MRIPMWIVMMVSVCLPLSSEPFLCQHIQFLQGGVTHAMRLLQGSMVEQEVVPFGGAWNGDDIIALAQ